MSLLFKNIEIGCDQDSVITNWPKAAREAMSKNFPYLPHIKVENQKNWEFEKNFPKKFQKEISQMYFNPQPGFYYNMEPIPGAIETLRKMKEMGANLTIVTSPLPIGKEEFLEHYDGSREKQAKVWLQVVEEKIMWLLKHAPDLESTFMPLHAKHLYHGKYLIDDRPNVGDGHSPYWKQITFNNGYGWIDPETKNQANWKNMIQVITELERPQDTRSGVGC